MPQLRPLLYDTCLYREERRTAAVKQHERMKEGGTWRCSSNVLTKGQQVLKSGEVKTKREAAGLYVNSTNSSKESELLRARTSLIFSTRQKKINLVHRNLLRSIDSRTLQYTIDSLCRMLDAVASPSYHAKWWTGNH